LLLEIEHKIGFIYPTTPIRGWVKSFLTEVKDDDGQRLQQTAKRTRSNNTHAHEHHNARDRRVMCVVRLLLPFDRLSCSRHRIVKRIRSTTRRLMQQLGLKRLAPQAISF